MEFEGTVLKVLPVVKGTSQRGEWIKQEVVFELPGEFNRKLCVGFWGGRVARIQWPLVHRSARMEDDTRNRTASRSRAR